jgi:hypothetical protein
MRPLFIRDKAVEQKAVQHFRENRTAEIQPAQTKASPAAATASAASGTNTLRRTRATKKISFGRCLGPQR